jgi:predicted RND superfamily exporter protein
VAFGLLIAGNMVTCCVAALVIVPALISLWFNDEDLLEQQDTVLEAEVQSA